MFIFLPQSPLFVSLLLRLQLVWLLALNNKEEPLVNRELTAEDKDATPV